MIRRGVLTLAVGVVAVVLAVSVAARNGSAATACGRAFIPAYMPPAQLAALSRFRGNGSILVVNPSSGPGAAPQAAYKDAVQAVQAAGWRVLGYVPTDYGARPASAVRADASRYAAWYGVDGSFLDEAAAGADQLPYYRALRAAIPGLLAINPGIVPDAGYLAVADLIVTYEGPYAGYAEAASPAWLPRNRTVHLVYAAPATLAAQRDVYSYATSGTLPDPWSALPAFAATEIQRLDSC